jgi:hypothetical protein
MRCFKTKIVLSTTRYSPNSVLMIEPNPFHDEILPGFCYYFNKLGFNATILLLHRNYKAKVFHLYEKRKRPKVLCINEKLINKVIKHSHKFDYVLLSSNNILNPKVNNQLFHDLFMQYAKGKKGSFIIEHYYQYQLLSIPQILQINGMHVFALSEWKNSDIPMLNPNYFGPKLIKSKHKTLTFISVGRRQYSILFDAVNKLIEMGYVDFQVFVIGRYLSKSSFASNLPSQIKILGKLKFDALYHYLLQSDYFLPLLGTNEDDNVYLNGQTTGSRQLILGFNIVPLIQTQFAEVYNFDNTNAIVYDDSLFEAMLQAINLPKEELLAKENSLRHLMEDVRNKSFNNLKSIILP